MQAGKFGSRAQKIRVLMGVAVLLGCVSRNSNSDKSSGAQSAVKATNGNDVAFCPVDSTLNTDSRSCVTRGGFVLGPFPLELQERCREVFPSDSAVCVQKQDWPIEMFKRLASEFKNGCPLGTRPEGDRLCISSGFVHGPFLRSEVQACRKLTDRLDPAACEQLVWTVEMFRKVRDELEAKKAVRVNEQSAATSSSTPAPSARDLESLPIVVLTPRPRNAPQVDAPVTAMPSPERVLNSSPTAIPTPASTPKVVVATPKPTPTVPTATATETSVSGQTETFVEPPTYCVYSWDERPGTADFTTVNPRLSSLGQPVAYRLDRREQDTLLRSQDFQAMDVCMRARFLKKCFQRVILESDSHAAQKFRAWSLGRVRPVEAHMAFVMKESRLGLWPDACSRGRCKGVGIAKVTRGLTPSGRTLTLNDSAWRGITHNIITNLDFSLRLIVDKVSRGPVDLYALAYLYHENPRTKERYAIDVDRYYKQLISCQLEER